MRPTSQSVTLSSFRSDWRRWTDIVARFARQRPSRRRVRPRDYEALQRRLVWALHEQAEADPDRREYFARLATLASPWLTLGTLERTDRALLLDLIAQCERADVELNGKRLRLPVRVFVWLAVLVGLGAGAVYAYRYLDDAWMTVRRSTRAVADDWTDAHQLLGAGVVLSLLAMAWVWYTRRT